MAANRIKEFREKQGLSQTELARRARVASQNLSSIERGKLEPWDKAKRAIAKGLKCTVDDVFPLEQANLNALLSSAVHTEQNRRDEDKPLIFPIPAHTTAYVIIIPDEV